MGIDKEALTKQIEVAAEEGNADFQADAERFEYRIDLTVSFGKAATIEGVIQALHTSDLAFSDEFHVEDDRILISYEHIRLEDAFALAKTLEENQTNADLEVTALEPYASNKIYIAPVTLYSKEGPK